MIYVSKLAGEPCMEYLRAVDSVTTVGASIPDGLVYDQISTHADIFMCKLGIAPDAPVVFAEPSELGYEYPGDIAFNAVCTGRYFIHNTEHTSPRLLKQAEDLGMQTISVKQGYTRCNVAVVDEMSVITSDRGIAASLTDTDIDCLLIRSGCIDLQGFDYGFIGGACGIVRDVRAADAGTSDILVFNGDISAHPDWMIIEDFVRSRGVDIRYFDYPLEDIGSIIQSNTH